MANATVAVRPHRSQVSLRYGWNLLSFSGLYSWCMFHVRPVLHNLTACMDTKQDENDSGHHTMDKVKLEKNVLKINGEYRKQTCLVVADASDYCRRSASR